MGQYLTGLKLLFKKQIFPPSALKIIFKGTGNKTNVSITYNRTAHDYSTTETSDKTDFLSALCSPVMSLNWERTELKDKDLKYPNKCLNIILCSL